MRDLDLFLIQNVLLSFWHKTLLREKIMRTAEQYRFLSHLDKSEMTIVESAPQLFEYRSLSVVTYSANTAHALRTNPLLEGL